MPTINNCHTLNASVIPSPYHFSHCPILKRAKFTNIVATACEPGQK